MLIVSKFPGTEGCSYRGGIGTISWSLDKDGLFFMLEFPAHRRNGLLMATNS